MKHANEFTILEYEDQVHAEVLKDLQTGDYGYKFRLIDGVVMPPYVTPSRYELSRTIKTRTGDICYVSYPKSGSTWLAYILFLIINNGQVPNEDTLRSNLHWVESSWTYPRMRSELEALTAPRLFKSHMPYEMALGGKPAENPAKYVYIARNPKDVVVSYYFFEREKSWSGYYAGPWEHWLEMFMNGRVQRGDWFDHVLSWWNQRHAPNIIFITYEELKRQFEQTVTKLADFLEFPLGAEVIGKIRKRTSFRGMQEQHFSNMHEIKEFRGFFRRGQIGSWKNQFTELQNQRFDELYTSRMEDSGLNFEME